MPAKRSGALRAGIGYTIGNILIKGINFLTVPLFSRILTTAEFGGYSVFLSYDAILAVVVGLSLHTSVKSAHYEFEETDQYVSSVSLIYILDALLFLAAIILGGQPLSDILGFKEIVLILLVPFSFGGAIVQLYNEKISLDYSYKKYLIISVLNSVGNVLLSLLFIYTAFRTQRDIGRILGTTAAIFVIAVFLLGSMYKKAWPRFSRKYWSFGVKYSLPIVPHGISQVLLSSFDRVMISSMVGNVEAGIYSLAGNIKLILTVISNSIATAWSTWFYTQIKKGAMKEIQKSATQLCALFTIFTVGLMALSPEIIYLLGGTKYLDAKYVAIPMILDAFVLFFYLVIVPSEYYTKKTVYIMGGTMAAAAINLATNYIFIKQFGYTAAAYTTLFSYVCYLFLHVVISYRLVKFYVVPLKWIGILTVVAAGMAIIDLVFINVIWIRYAACAVVVIAFAPRLVKEFLKSRRNEA